MHGLGTQRLLVVVTVAWVYVVTCVAQDVEIPRLSQYATDLTGTLTSQQLQMLNAKLRDFDQTTSNQVVFLMVSTIGAGSLEDFTMRVVEKNQVGTKGKDNGVLLFVAKDDRQVRIEVGYGLEGVLPDALAGQIVRREITPRFVEGDFFGGVNAGIEAIILATRNEYKAEPQGRGTIPIPLILILIFFGIFMMRALTAGRRFVGRGHPPVFFPPTFGGGNRGGWGGSSGGFGGFSGGGGSFGGGGASGHW